MKSVYNFMLIATFCVLSFSCASKAEKCYSPSLSLKKEESFLTKNEFYSKNGLYNYQLRLSSEKTNTLPGNYIEYIQNQVKKGMFIKKICFYFFGEISHKLSIDTQIKRIIEKYEKNYEGKVDYKLYRDKDNNSEISVIYFTETATYAMTLTKHTVNDFTIFLPISNFAIGTTQ